MTPPAPREFYEAQYHFDEDVAHPNLPRLWRALEALQPLVGMVLLDLGSGVGWGAKLALERGRVITRDELLQKIWGRREAHRDRTVDVFVRRLRDKIDRRAPRHTFIQTRYGVGYRLDPVTKE